MGADIHFYVEKKVDGVWQIHGDVEREDYGDGDVYVSVKSGFCDDRCYNAFAILADVRNGRGFAGIRTGEGFNPISAPRGIPEDASDVYKEITDRWESDGHSHSYHTLGQLLNYDWMQETKLQGWTLIKDYLPWVLRGKRSSGPDRYCGAVSGGSIKHLTQDEADDIVAQYKKMSWEEKETYLKSNHLQSYVLAEWGVNYAEASSYVWSDTIPRLLSLAGGLTGLEDVRIVFFFDN
jgi:hypothetical protein